MTMADIKYAIKQSIGTEKKGYIEALYTDTQLTAVDRAKALKELCGTASWSLTFPDGAAGWLNCSRSKGAEIRKGAYGTGDVQKLTWAKVEKTIYWLMIDDSGRYRHD